MSVTPVNPINILNTLFQTMQSFASSLYGVLLPDGFEILGILCMIGVAWLLLNWILAAGLPELMAKGLSLLMKAAFILLLLNGWTTTTRDFFVNNMEQVAIKASGGTTPDMQSLLQTIWAGAAGMFQTTRNTAANPCVGVTGTPMTSASPEGAAITTTDEANCSSNSAPTEQGTFAALGTWIKNFPLIFVTLILKLLAMIAMVLMGLIFVFVVQLGSFLLAVAFILGPILVPWYVWDPASFLFDGWLRFTISAGLYKVVAWLLITIVIKGFLPAAHQLLDGIAASSGSNTDDYYGSAYLTYLAVAFICCLGVLLMREVPTIAGGIVSGQARMRAGGFGSGFVGQGARSGAAALYNMVKHNLKQDN